LFGSLLKTGRVLRYDKQLWALRLRDMAIVKFVLSTAVVGAAGVYLLSKLGPATLSVKATIQGPVSLGALIFGLGWGLPGWCREHPMAALNEERGDPVWGICGMIVGPASVREPIR
jgi:hypothetical protein